jgi:hypothetical protein
MVGVPSHATLVSGGVAVAVSNEVIGHDVMLALGRSLRVDLVRSVRDDRSNVVYGLGCMLEVP